MAPAFKTRPEQMARDAGSLVGFLEALELLVATFDSGIQRFFGLFFTGPDLFELFVVDGADLHKIAQTDAA